MRRLGERLQVEAMSLYNHVAGKDDILDGIVDLVFSEIALPSGSGDWKTAMRRASDLGPRRTAAPPLGDQPDAVADQTRSRDAAAPRLGDRQPSKGGIHARHGRPRVLRHGRLHLWLCAAAGEPAVHTPEEVAALAENILRELPADEYPYLAEMIVEHALKPGYDYALEFEFGLDLILDGLERLRGVA